MNEVCEDNEGSNNERVLNTLKSLPDCKKTDLSKGLVDEMESTANSGSLLFLAVS